MDDLEDFLMESIDLTTNDPDIMPTNLNNNPVSPSTSMMQQWTWCKSCAVKAKELEASYDKKFSSLKERLLFTDHMLKLYEETKNQLLLTTNKADDIERKYSRLKTENEISQNQLQALLSNQEPSANETFNLQKRVEEQNQQIELLKDQVASSDAARKLHEESIKAFRGNEAGEVVELKKKLGTRIQALTHDLSHKTKLIKSLRNKTRRLENEVERLKTRRPRRRTKSKLSLNETDDSSTAPTLRRRSRCSSSNSERHNSADRYTTAKSTAELPEVFEDSMMSGTSECESKVVKRKSSRTLSIKSDKPNKTRLKSKDKTPKKDIHKPSAVIFPSKETQEKHLTARDFTFESTNSSFEDSKTEEIEPPERNSCSHNITSPKKSLESPLSRRKSRDEALMEIKPVNEFSPIKSPRYLHVPKKQQKKKSVTDNISFIKSTTDSIVSTFTPNHSNTDAEGHDLEQKETKTPISDDSSSEGNNNKSTSSIIKSPIKVVVKSSEKNSPMENEDESIKTTAINSFAESIEAAKNKRPAKSKSTFQLRAEKRKIERLKLASSKSDPIHVNKDKGQKSLFSPEIKTLNATDTVFTSPMKETSGNEKIISQPSNPTPIIEKTEKSVEDKLAYITSTVESTGILHKKVINDPKINIKEDKRQEKNLSDNFQEACSETLHKPRNKRARISDLQNMEVKKQRLSSDISSQNIPSCSNSLPVKSISKKTSKSYTDSDPMSLLSEIMSMPGCLSPIQDPVFVEQFTNQQGNHEFNIPDIIVDEPDYSPVVTDNEEDVEDNLPASGPLCTSINFEKSRTPAKKSRTVSSPHNITKPRRFSCEAPQMAVPVPSFKPAVKTYSLSSPEQNSSNSRELRKTVSLPSTGNAPSHWQNTAKMLTDDEKVEKERTKSINGDLVDIMDISLNSENDFDPETFLDELSDSVKQRIESIDEDVSNTSDRGSSENILNINIQNNENLLTVGTELSDIGANLVDQNPDVLKNDLFSVNTVSNVDFSTNDPVAEDMTNNLEDIIESLGPNIYSDTNKSSQEKELIDENLETFLDFQPTLDVNDNVKDAKLVNENLSQKQSGNAQTQLLSSELLSETTKINNNDSSKSATDSKNQENNFRMQNKNNNVNDPIQTTSLNRDTSTNIEIRNSAAASVYSHKVVLPASQAEAVLTPQTPINFKQTSLNSINSPKNVSKVVTTPVPLTDELKSKLKLVKKKAKTFVPFKKKDENSISTNTSLNLSTALDDKVITDETSNLSPKLQTRSKTDSNKSTSETSNVNLNSTLPSMCKPSGISPYKSIINPLSNSFTVSNSSEVANFHNLPGIPKAHRPKETIASNEQYQVADEQLDVNLANDMNKLINLAATAVKTSHVPERLDLTLLLRCITFNISLADSKQLITPKFGTNAKETMESLLTTVELQFVKTIIILHRKGCYGNKLIQHLILPTLLRMLTRFGAFFNYFLNNEDISITSTNVDSMKTALNLILHQNHLSASSTFSLARLYGCFAYAVNCPHALLDLTQYCFLWKKHEIMVYIMQALLCWPSVFKHFPLVGNSVAQGFRKWISDRTQNKNFNQQEYYMHVSWICKESGLAAYDEENSPSLWKKSIEECVPLLQNAKMSQAYSEAFSDSSKSLDCHFMFDNSTNEAIECLEILAKEHDNSSALEQIIEKHMWPLLNSWSQHMVIHGNQKEKPVTDECVLAVLEAVCRVILNFLSRQKFKHKLSAVSIGPKLQKSFSTICSLLDNFTKSYSSVADIRIQFCTAAFVLRTAFIDTHRAHTTLVRWFKVTSDSHPKDEIKLEHRMAIYFNSDKNHLRNIIEWVESKIPSSKAFAKLSNFL